MRMTDVESGIVGAVSDSIHSVPLILQLNMKMILQTLIGMSSE